MSGWNLRLTGQSLENDRLRKLGQVIPGDYHRNHLAVDDQRRANDRESKPGDDDRRRSLVGLGAALHALREESWIVFRCGEDVEQRCGIEWTARDRSDRVVH